ncbi:synaptojanin-1 isoform X3 [Oopsacas minuta]|uniref:phosphatidylinositol-3,4,5-trisphosphate 5-phosphatase n=1 Tax=Oopsacas minuta TaxID=111878 RepID=A0AAV7K4C3_9METZ|nr:synaptojanin-1 isoform X3 [Oopsacas minuta]
MSTSEESPPWYHTGLSRNRAEEMLVQADKNGSFIVRTSESISGAYVLSEFFNNRVHHYRILPSEKGFFIECPGTTNLQYFKSLIELIEYYGKPKRGLVCELTYAVEQDEDDDDDNIVSLETNTKFFNALSARIPNAIQDTEFERQFREYFSKHLMTDSLSFVNNHSMPKMLYQLFENDISTLYTSIDLFQKRLRYAYQLMFLAMGNTNDILQSPTSNPNNDFASVISTMKDTTDLVFKTEQLFNKLLLQLSNEPSSEDTYQIYKDNIESKPKRMIDVGRESFEVKICHKMNHSVIEVNTYDGILTILNNGHKEDIPCLDLQKIIKSQNNPLFLSIVKRLDESIGVLFTTLSQRERFCEISLLMINHHNYKIARNNISLFVGTWNMGEASPPDSLETWLSSKGTGINLPGYLDRSYDLYIIGVQENDTLMRIPSSDWPTKLRNHISNMNKLEYKIIAFEHFWHIGLVGIIKSDLYHKVSNIQQANVKTGLGKINVGTKVGNKGAVGVSFAYENTSFLFVNCHLTSGHEQKRLAKRRANFRDIMKNLIFKSPHPHCDITNQFNYTFFFGDLNYRIDLEPDIILEKITEADFYYLKRHDQLTIELERNNSFFAFEEAPVRFPPTYRYIRGSRSSYHILKKKAVKDKINVPSYCDRILFKSYLNSPILPTSYGCSDEIFTSDHSPVFASFVLGIQAPDISRAPAKALSMHIMQISIGFESFEAHITRSNANEIYYLQLFSDCFDGFRKSKHCSSIRELSSGSNNVVAKWTPKELPERIIPVNQERDFLIQQVVFVQIKCVGGDDDTFGETHISLSDFIGKSPQPFHKVLTYQSYPVGSIHGSFHIYDPSSKATDVNIDDTYARLEFTTSSDIDYLYDEMLANKSHSSNEGSKMVAIAQPKSSVGVSSISIEETIESLQNTELEMFLIKYGLGKYYSLLLRSGFKDTIQLYYLDEKYLDNMGITGEDGKKFYSLAQYICQHFSRSK